MTFRGGERERMEKTKAVGNRNGAAVWMPHGREFIHTPIS